MLADAEDQTQEGLGDINAKWQQLKIAYEQTRKACLGTKQKEGVDHRGYLASHCEQKNSQEESRGSQIRAPEREIQAKRREANLTVKRMTRTEK